MSILNFNNNNINLFKDESRYDDFKSLAELYNENGADTQYPVKGVYVYNSKYGESCFIKSNGYNIQLPNHLSETVKGIRDDEESVNQINSGVVFISIYSYTLPDKYPNKTFYSINFELGQDNK